MKNAVYRHMETIRMGTTPVQIPRTIRQDRIQVGSTMKPGKWIPLKAIPLLREDSLVNCPIEASFEMMETAELLMNAVQVQMCAYFVPFLAMDRFNGREEFDKSYSGLPFREGDDVISFFETEAFGDPEVNEIYKYLGLHAKSDAQVNTAYAEAYNQIINFRRKNLSPDLTLRNRLDKTLAVSEWAYNKFAHIVPDYDQAKIDGVVPLNLVDSSLPVMGIGRADKSAPVSRATNYYQADGSTLGADSQQVWDYQIGNATGEIGINVKEDASNPGNWLPDIRAEMQQGGLTISLADIDLARETRAWAKVREQFNMHEDWMIDMFMNGLSLPDKFWEQPILIGRGSTVFGYQKRYASDGSNLTESVVNGATGIQMRLNVPRQPTGGIVMIMASVTPEQLFERQKDSFFHLGTVDLLPETLGDHLDPEKVVDVRNDFIDVDHDDGDDFLGWSYLNHEWDRELVNMGGDFYRPEVDAAFDEKRQRLWAEETQNPTLGTTFYLCPDELQEKPFAQTTYDNFEVVLRGQAKIAGLTQFGKRLIEASDDYEQVKDAVDTEFNDKDELTAPAT